MFALSHRHFSFSYIVKSTKIKKDYLEYKLNCVSIVENWYERHIDQERCGALEFCGALCFSGKVSDLRS